MKEIGLDHLLGPPNFIPHASTRPRALLQGRGQEMEPCTHCRLGPGPQIETYGVSGGVSRGTLELVPEVVSEGFRYLGSF